MSTRPHSSRASRLLLVALSASLVWPAHAAPLVFSQLPPASATPPAPNVIVTLDDSGSMEARNDAFNGSARWFRGCAANLGDYRDPSTKFVAGREYPVPLGPTGTPIVTMPAAPNTYNDGYAINPPAISLPTCENNNYNALSAAHKPAYLRWYAFYSSRNKAMKAAVMQVFHSNSIPDGKVRLAWQVLTPDCPSSGGFSAASTCRNAMWPLSDSEGGRTHRTNFYNWVRNVDANGNGTPLRAAYERVGQYLMTTGVNSPWAHLPGTTQLPEVSCRRAYQLLFTDGGWNGGGPNNERDNVARTLPDGTSYTPRGPYAHNWAGTLADVAFHYWATDLQTGANFQNDISPLTRVAGVQRFVNTDVAPYWNPNNNPASWQHLVTFAIAFGGAASITNPQWEGSTTAGAHFAQLVAGTRSWPQVEEPDLWHAAVNSRGAMFLASDQAALDAAFKAVMNEIASQNVSSGGAASSYSVDGGGFRIVRAGYKSAPNLRGSLEGFGLTSGGLLATEPAWDANAQLASVAANSRVVLTATAPLAAGAAFRWNSLSTWQKGELNKSMAGANDGQGNFRVDYLRGDTSREPTPGPQNAAANLFRWRQGGLLGTIVNSEPKIVAAPRSGYTSADYVAFRSANLNRTPVAYVGANDGMLHGFRADTGAPLLSYVPRGVYPGLSAYTDPAHQHRMYVDGPLVTADWHDGSGWRTILVGALGAGGRGLFGLDITNPANFTEGNAASVVRFDYTAPPVAQTSTAFTSESGNSGLMAELASDLGHIATDPSRDAYLGRSLQVTRLRNGKWALITGNGVNSVNERAALYVIYLDGSGFRKLLPETTTGQGNGLSTPLPVDVNGDGLVDFVYGGDQLGRLWKFDLSNANDAQWKVVQVSGVNTPLINVGRPITTAPAVAEHPSGGLLVTFGTGRSMTEADRASTTTEYLYGVWDKPGGPFQVAADALVERTLSGTSATTTGSSIYARVIDTPSSAVDYSTKRGWRISLGVSKERVIFNPIVQGRIAYYSTYMPATASSCAIRDNGSLLTFDVINGGQPATPVVDINGDGLFSTADRITGKDVMGRSSGIGRLIGLLEAPAGSSAASGCAGDMIMGSTGMICAKKPPGPGRRAWRDMRP